MRSLSLAIAVVALAVSSVDGAGLYNLPTSMAQCMGVGFGPGYHAPLLLGPAMKAPGASQRVRRVPAPFAPPSGAGGFGRPSCLSCGQADPYAGQTSGYAPGYAASPAAPAEWVAGPVFAVPAGPFPNAAAAHPAPAAEVLPAPTR